MDSLPHKLDSLQESAINSLEGLRDKIEISSRVRHSYLSFSSIRQFIKFFSLGLSSKSELSSHLKGGFYIHGGVGRGKTMIMDYFYSSLTEFSFKHRFHYHDFMRLVHEVFNNIRSRGKSDSNAIEYLLDEILGRDCAILCLDEVDVIDIADAMILLRLFEVIVGRGLILVMTSNLRLEELYKDGINREKFIPFIELMTTYVEQIDIGLEGDYRQDFLGGKSFWFCGNDEENYHELNRVYNSWSSQGLEGDKWLYLSTGGRKILSHRREGDKVWFQFEALCGDTLGARDYLKISHQFRRVIIEDLPSSFEDMSSDRLRRFVLLIDVFYDEGVILAVSSSDEFRIEESEVGDKYGLPRALSRLQEMLSSVYVSNLEKSFV